MISHELNRKIKEEIRASKTLRELSISPAISYKKQEEIRGEQEKHWKKLQFLRKLEKEIYKKREEN